MIRLSFLSRRRHALYLAFCFLFAAAISFALGNELNFNTYYRFPLSLGVEYQSLSPFAAYGSQYNIFDLSANLRWPIPSIPILQPTLKAGMMRFDSQDQDEPLKWDHTRWYGVLGLDVSHRFAKNFEIGGELLAGFSEAVFSDLLPEEGLIGTSNLLFELGGRVALNPSYNFSIDVHPNLKYLLSLGPLKDYDGLIFGIGFAGSFRFGQDPDAPGAVIRSIRFDQVSFPALFAAMQSYYVKHPVGTVTVTNTDKQAVTDVAVSFMQPGYMDSPTQAGSILELKAGETRQIELFASFNQEVFRTEGVTPLTGEVIISYKSKGRAAEQRQSVSYDLHDKTAVTWDDDQKVAAFITPADSALRNYSSFIRQACKEETIPTYNDPLQLAVQVFHALGEIGCLYQADPALPFTKVQENPMVVDSISLPRDTLKRITGDCDDLTVLYCSVLETAGTETGFITVPGHIYAAFNTKVEGRDYAKLHPDRGMTINLEGELWVPVEITLIGKTGFLEAWRKGMEEWAAFDNSPEKRGFFNTRKCQELYRPVGLKETDLGLQYGRKENILGGFRKDLDKLIETMTEETRSAARKGGKKQDYNKLGILYAEVLHYGQAEEAFNEALKLDPAYDSARINLANVLFLNKDYPAALARFQDAYREIERKGEGNSAKGLKVLLNISKTCYQMANYPEAQEYFVKAQAIDPEQVKQFAYLTERRPDKARAAEGKDPAYEVLFLEE
jgi:tetratricopeptide (TPR) repeat protein